MSQLTDSRSAGVLLHISSLPNGPDDIAGNIGRDAHRFVDWLKLAGFSVWQVLPLGPLHADKSPYLSLSAFAGNSDFISLESLRDDKELQDTWLTEHIQSLGHYTLEGLISLLEHNPKLRFRDLPGAQEFLQKNSYWLQPYAQFCTVRKALNNQPWWQWPEPLKLRETDAVRRTVEAHDTVYRAIIIEQYIFQRQWHSLQQYANAQGIKLFGDIPLYIAQDSADIWANQAFFQLDKQGQPLRVAGVPPDYFSTTGQLWNNPLYDWEAMQADHFSWWLNRVRRQLDLLDILRIDHFRALQAYYSIPAGAENAIHGDWIEAPGAELLSTIRSTLGALPLIAEDLGVITEEVNQLRDAYELPGMRVLQFGFDGNTENPHLAINIDHNTVAYTGTHDNDTVLGWYRTLDTETRINVHKALDADDEHSVLNGIIDTTLACPAALTILPMQDILALGAGHRMNTPGTIGNNWHWRLSLSQLDEQLAQHYKRRLSAFNRLASSQH